MKKIVVEGFVFSGKNELITDLKNNWNTTVINPLENNIGDIFLWLYNQKKYGLVNDIFINSIKQKESNVNYADLLIYEKHWPTVFSVIPESYWDKWLPMPPTIICWAPPDVIIERAKKSKTKIEFDGYIEYGCEIYKKLAKKFDCKFIDTSCISRDDILAETLKFIKKEC